MDEEFARVAYTEHHALFRHYSEQIFRTRISIITLIVLFFAYVFGVLPFGQRPVDRLTTAMFAYLSAVLVALLFSIEAQYYRRLIQVVVAGRKLERSQEADLYFHIIDKVSHWQLFLLYVSSIGVLSVIAVTNFLKSPQRLLYDPVVIALALVPGLMCFWTVWRFSASTKQLLAAGKVPEGKKVGDDGGEPNPSAAPDASVGASK